MPSELGHLNRWYLAFFKYLWVYPLTNLDRVQRPSRDVHCNVRACGARTVKALTFEPSVANELMINGEPFGHHNNKEIARFSLFFSRGSLVLLFRSGVRS